MAESGLFSSCFIVLIYLLHSHGFNLDTKVPIVKEGSTDSYFGFSVAQHQIKQLNSGDARHVFLVGAPQDNLTDPSLPDTVSRLVRPGAVYYCPLSASRDDCSWMKIDGDEPLYDDQKDNQWMGVSVASMGTENGGAVACAHRYTRGGDTDAFRYGLGQCVSVSNNLDEDQYLMPCGGLPKEDLLESYALCQAGTSATLDKDGELLVGAPGSWVWRGAIFKNSIVRSLDSDETWYRSPAEDVKKNPDGPPPIGNYFSYLGMSTQIAKIHGDEKSYITGAPRSNDVGQVLMFRHDPAQSPFLNVLEDNVLTGEQFGSWFGCDFAVLDLNGDGKQDIVVGAPFYNEKEQGNRISGAVYIYLNSIDGITERTEPTKITSRQMTRGDCDDLDCENARFGFSVEPLGDIDLDGYEDFAVGAPFEGNGAVYIYRGQDNAEGVELEFSQRITADELVTAGSLKSFGYSLSGGNDMDDNGYPDLVVGSYASAKALVLRTRPVVKVEASIHSSPTKINPDKERCIKDGKNSNCFELTLCFNFSAEPKSRFTEGIDLDYKLEAEVFTGKRYSRVHIKGATKPDDYAIERSITLNDQFNTNLKCRGHLVYVVKNNKDFLNPIQFRLTYKLSAKEQDVPVMNEGDLRIPDINSYPILNEAKSKVLFAVPFEKNCGTDDECHSDLSIDTNFELPNDPETDNPLLKVGVDTNLRMEVTVRNGGEDAHDTNIYITIPEHISYRGTSAPDGGPGPSCVLTTVKGVWTCSIGNPLGYDERKTFIVRMDAKDISSTVKVIQFTLKVNTTSIETNLADDTNVEDVRVIVEANLLVRGSSIPSEVFYAGEVKGESAIKLEEDIGTEIRHVYEIKNTMKGKVPQSLLTIAWPYEVHSKLEHGKHLLYLMEPPMVDDPTKVSKCHTEAYMINPLGITQGSTPPSPIDVGEETNYTIDADGSDVSRSRRKREDVIRSESVRDDKGRRLEVVNLDCRQGTAKCYYINCTIGELRDPLSVVITLRARLWNHTFLEDYREVDRVNVYSSAELKIDPVFNIKETEMGDNTAEALTRAIPDIKVQSKQSIPWWIILIAVLAAIIVLIIIVVVLWKCGFFKRRRPDDMKRHKGKIEKKKFDDDYYN